MKNLTTGYRGGIYPVNPKYSDIEGIPCYPSVDRVPDPVDLAIVFVPGHRVIDVIEKCAERGIRGVMIESSGFAETGEEGRNRQARLKDIVRRTGIRVWGPNCMGLVDAPGRKIFSFVSPGIWEYLTPGKVSLVVQSGMLSGAFLIDLMSHGVTGVSKVCAVGNKVDVEECELLEYLTADPETAAVGLYLESLVDARRLIRLCGKSSKPIVVLKGGKSPRGAAAAMSHTASLAGDAAVIRGALMQAGVTEATDFFEMMDLCRTLSVYPDVKTRGDGAVAVLTYSGGAGIVTSDFIHPTPLTLADLSEKTLETLKSVFPEWMAPANPVDLWPAVEQHGSEAAFGRALSAVLEDPGVDAVFVHAFCGGFALNLNVRDMAALARTAGKPLFFWVMGTSPAVIEFQKEGHAAGAPVFREIGRAVTCMAAVFARKRFSSAPVEDIFPETPPLPRLTRDLLSTARGVVDEEASKKILGSMGVPVVREIPAGSPDEALRAAASLGYPVVLKGMAPGVAHKTENGLVRLDIRDPEALKEAYGMLMTRMGGDGGVLVQRQIRGRTELIAGVVNDPSLGPCVMIGMGGVLAEAIRDVAYAPAPLTRNQALGLIDRLSSRKILNGFRGEKAVDRGRVADILVALGRLASRDSRIREIDINPLVVADGCPVAVDALMVMSD